MKALGQNGVLLQLPDPIKENGSVPPSTVAGRGVGVSPGRAQSTCQLQGRGEGLGERGASVGAGAGKGSWEGVQEGWWESGELAQVAHPGEHRFADAGGHGPGPQQ